MKIPALTCEVKISSIGLKTNSIVFYSTPDAVTNFYQFGNIYNNFPNCYQIFVDPRYNFQEVIDYISNYGKEEKNV